VAAMTLTDWLVVLLALLFAGVFDKVRNGEER
jgi:hypothetical protein